MTLHAMARRIDGAMLGLEELKRRFDMLERHGPAARHSVHRPPEYKTSKRAWRAFQPRNVEKGDGSRFAVGMTPAPFFELASDRLQPGPCFTGKLRFVGEYVDDGRVESFYEKRHELGPDSVARDGDVAIGFVVYICHTPLVQVSAQLDPATVKDRPNNRAIPRIHGRQAPRACAAHKPEEEGFRLVVARMPERHDVCIELPPSALKKPVPGFPRGILNRPTLATRARSDVLPFSEKRQIQRSRHRRGKLLVALGRFTPKLMVEVRGPDQTDVARGVELAQDPHEGD
jgi:hypothetical protein